SALSLIFLLAAGSACAQEPSSIDLLFEYIDKDIETVSTSNLQVLAQRLNYDCRGGVGRPFKTQVICSLRDDLFSYLQEERDSCYDGSASLLAHQQGWMSCKNR